MYSCDLLFRLLNLLRRTVTREYYYIETYYPSDDFSRNWVTNRSGERANPPNDILFYHYKVSTSLC